MSDDKDALERHGVAFEPPDVVTSAPKGILTLDDARVVWQFAGEACAQTERIYWLSDISRLERYAPGDPGETARKVMAKLFAVAIIGGNFQQRTFIAVIFRAGRLLGSSRVDAEYEFFRDESSARAWIDSLRKKHAAQSR